MSKVSTAFAMNEDSQGPLDNSLRCHLERYYNDKVINKGGLPSSEDLDAVMEEEKIKALTGKKVQ